MRYANSLRRSVLGVVAAIGLTAAMSPVPAHAQPTRETLESQGWVCVPFPAAGVVACFTPGPGRPIPGNPDPAASHTLFQFDLTTGERLFVGHLVRSDLYGGQPCPGTGDAYRYLPLIGYYECLH